MKTESDFIKPYQAALLIGFKEQTGRIKKYRDLMIEQFGDKNSGLIPANNIHNFLGTHTSLAVLRDEINSFSGMSENSFTTVYKKVFDSILKIAPKYFSNRLNTIYLKNEDYEKSLEYYKKLYDQPNCVFYFKLELLEHLDLVVKSSIIDEILDEYGIRPCIITGTKTMYHIQDLQQLKLVQKNEIETFNERFISVTEVAKRLNNQVGAVNHWVSRNEIKIISPPLITRKKNHELSRKTNFIPRDMAEKYIYEVEFKRHIDTVFINYDIQWDPFETFSQLVNLYGYHFSSVANRTERYWHLFVKSKIHSTEVQDLKSFIHKFVHITGFLVNVVNASSKELFSFTSEEINFSLLNDMVHYTYREKYYSFIKQVHIEMVNMGGPSIFDINTIRSPKQERKKNHVPKEKVIYKPDIFVALFKYCSKEIEYHKQESIKDALLYGQQKFSAYASMWLYVILHLTNTWRHSDVVIFPRLKGLYKGKTLDWFKSYQLNEEEADLIVAYYEQQSYFHLKNNKTRYFIISEDLKVPFATAVLVCELIQREYDNEIVDIEGQISTECPLIDFRNSSNRPSKATHDAFFDKFLYKIVFENRKMNWTVTTLATDVISKLTGRNPLEIAKFLRNHSDEEITNIYIQLPREYIDFLSKQLFNIGTFGYIYDAMAQIIFDDTTTPLKYDGALAVKDAFGQPEVIESISKHLVALNKDRDYVIKALKDTPKDEVEKRMTYLKSGLMPSKRLEFECLIGVSNCPYPKRDCDNCHLSIPNRLAICKIGVDINEVIDEIMKTFIKTPHKAEKVRLSIKFYRQHQYLSTAIAKYGRDIVNQLVPGGLDAINIKMKHLPESKHLVSDEFRKLLMEGGL